jgi:hypothetical protein
MHALTKNKTEWKEVLYFTTNLELKELSKYFATVTPMTGVPIISAEILDPVRLLQWFRMLDNGMNINPKAETSSTRQCIEAFMKYVENEYSKSNGTFSIIKHKTKLCYNHFFSDGHSILGWIVQFSDT